MNIRKYRICLLLFIMIVLAGSVCYYAWSKENRETPRDGMLVERCEMYEDDIVA